MNPHHIASLTRAELPTYPALNHLKAWDVPFFDASEWRQEKNATPTTIISLPQSHTRPFQAQWPCCLIHSNAPSNGSKGAGWSKRCAVAKPRPNATARSMRDMADFCPKGARGHETQKLGPSGDSRQEPDFFSWRIPSGYFNMRMEKHNFKWVNSRTRWATYIIARQQIAGSCIPFSDPKNNRVSSLGHAFQAVIQFPWSADDSCDWGGA